MPVSDESQWIDGPQGRIAVTLSGYRTDYVGQMSYALNNDTVYRHVGYRDAASLYGEPYLDAMIVAEPAFTITVGTFIFPPTVRDCTDCDVAIAGVDIGNGTTAGVAHRSEGFIDLHWSVNWGTTSTADGIQTGEISLVWGTTTAICSWGYFYDDSAGIYYPLLPTGTGLYQGRADVAGGADFPSFHWDSSILISPPVDLAGNDVVVVGCRLPLDPELSLPEA